MSEWKEIEFSECLIDESISYGIVQPGSDVRTDSVPIIRVQNIKNGVIDTSDVRHVSKEIEEKYYRTRLQGGELLITVVGSVGETAIVPENLKGWNVARAVSVARIKDSFNKYFIKYLFATEDAIFQMYGNTNDTVQPTLNLKELKRLVFNIPKKNEQDEIAEVLSSLDDKVDLLHRQNQTLENLGQALLTKCFENVKEEENSLSDFFELLGGFAFKSKTYVDDGAYKVLTIKAVQDGYLETGNAATIIDLPEKLKEYQKLSIGDILMSLTGNVGRVCLVDETNCLLNQRVALVKPRDHALKSFAYFFFRQPEMITRLTYLSKGSAQLNLSPVETLNEREFFPKDESLNQFRNLADPILHKIISNKLSIHKVKALRDTLLPKLMVGEIRIDTNE